MSVTLSSCRVNAPPDPLVLARRVWQRPGSVLLWTASGSGPSYVACDPIGFSNALDPEPDLPWGRAREAAHGLDGVPRWIGAVAYEALRSQLERPAFSAPDTREQPLCANHVWQRYGAVAVVDVDGVHVVGDDSRRVHTLRALLERPHEREASPAMRGQGDQAVLRLVEGGAAQNERELEAHRSRVKRALELIDEGDIYQVNLARRLDFELEGDGLALLQRMSSRVKAPYAAAFEIQGGHSIVSTSPELLLQTDAARRVLTEPIKGTRRLLPEQEAELRAELEFDPKERAELSMVVDIERNDIGRIAEYGSVIAETPRVIACDTVLHRVARVRGVARPDVSRAEVLAAMVPSGSVTGAPKIRAMEWVAQLEAHRRGLYTGGLGYLAHGGCLKLGMAIRCLVRRGSVGHYHVGGGIVIGSDPERELEETFWKAQQVLSL